jgi:hypothetical protein
VKFVVVTLTGASTSPVTACLTTVTVPPFVGDVIVIVGSAPLEPLLLPLLLLPPLLLPLLLLELPPSWPPPLLAGLLLLLHASAVANTPIPAIETRVVSFIVASGLQA